MAHRFRFHCGIDKLIDESGYLMAAFIMQAIEEFAGEVVATDPNQITKDTNGWVRGEDWLECARRAQVALDRLRKRSAA